MGSGRYKIPAAVPIGIICPPHLDFRKEVWPAVPAMALGAPQIGTRLKKGGRWSPPPVNGEVFYHEVGGMPFRMESFDGKIER